MSALTPNSAPNAARRRYKTPVPGPLYSEPPETGAYRLRRATGYTLDLVEKVLKSRISVDGSHNVPAKGPVLFVANHFTRFETFILPWILDRATRRMVHNLAHHELFVGRFGQYLNAIGARSTREPGIKDSIVGDLITGHHDWIIYPEGSMIKDKKTWHQGHLHLNAPDRVGPPHTGAALMALQAAMYKQLYLNAWRRQDDETMQALEERYAFTGSQLPREDLSIVPINITYYPFRPGMNLAYKMARLFLKRVPKQLEEELAVEGNLLLGETDISIYLGKPISLTNYLDALMPAAEGVKVGGHREACGEGGVGACSLENLVDRVMKPLKTRLTNHIMSEVYHHVTVNLDHLFCTALYASLQDRFTCDHLHRALYLAARNLQATGARRRHPSLDDSLEALVTGDAFPPLASIVALAEREGVLTREDGWYRIHRPRLEEQHAFHDVRVRNPLRVIANELEPLREAVKTVTQAINCPDAELRKRVASLLHQEDLAEFGSDYTRSSGDAGLKVPEVGAPFVLSGKTDRLGVVLSHGYLATPREVQELAQALNATGATVFGVRLAGHGTSPEDLSKVRWQAWRRSYARAYAAAAARCERVVVAGFSMGGLLALLTAADFPRRIDGVITINAPLHLADPASHLVPAVKTWNGLVHALRLNRLQWSFVPNAAEWPDANYDRNPVHGIYQLERLMAAVGPRLPEVRCPALIVQADHDPVVVPSSGPELEARIGSDEKELRSIASDRHGVLRGEGAEILHAQVAEFLDHLRDHWD